MILKLLQIPIFLFMLFCHSSAYANSPIFFGQYTYGMPKSEFENRPDVREGEKTLAGDLVMQGVTYIDLKWTASLSFTKNKLTSITLFAPYSRESMDAVTNTLKSSGYELLGMVIDDKAFDFLAHIKTSNPEVFQKTILDKIRTTKFNRISYAWFAISNVSKELKQRVANIGELLKMIDPQTQEIEVILLGNEHSNSPQLITLAFSFPVLSIMEN